MFSTREQSVAQRSDVVRLDLKRRFTEKDRVAEDLSAELGDPSLGQDLSNQLGRRAVGDDCEKPHGRLEAVGAQHRQSVTAAIVVAALCTLHATDAAAASAEGRWWAEGGSAQIEVRTCGQRDELCGTVVWLRSPFDVHGCELRDEHNPERDLRERPVLGLQILQGLKPSAGEEASWDGGEIYDPGSGRSFSCALTMDGEDRALLRGYFGIRLLGRTSTLLRLCGFWSGSAVLPVLV